ncbi:MAG: response regulator transcription factor [Deltaproteobacteria bacterium]|nr:response regulator transcription factor [Deltaproteobacteria bacterium]
MSEIAGALLEGIQEVLEGRTFLSPRLVPLMVRDWLDARSKPGSGSPLSPKELEVIRLFGEGYSVREIASRLGRSHKTVETYCARMKKKLGITSNRDLLRHAIEAVREGSKPRTSGSRG